jgi:hypothetical protein
VLLKSTETVKLRLALVLGIIGSCLLAAPARAQQQTQPEDPEDEKQVGLWLDQAISAPFSANKSVEIELHERFDEGASNLFEYFVQCGIAFRPWTWLMVLPSYRYQRFPGNPTNTYENRLLLNLTPSIARGRLRYSIRNLIEGRFPDDRSPSGRLRFRPGVEYTLPVRMTRPPVVVITNEFFLVPWSNSYASGGSYTQNRFQAGVRLPVGDQFAIRPYYMLQSVNLPGGWDTNEIVGISLAFKFTPKNK